MTGLFKIKEKLKICTNNGLHTKWEFHTIFVVGERAERPSTCHPERSRNFFEGAKQRPLADLLWSELRKNQAALRRRDLLWLFNSFLTVSYYYFRCTAECKFIPRKIAKLHTRSHRCLRNSVLLAHCFAGSPRKTSTPLALRSGCLEHDRSQCEEEGVRQGKK